MNDISTGPAHSAVSAARGRPEFIRETAAQNASFGIVEKPLTNWERIWNLNAVRKAAILILIIALWQAYAMWLGKELLFPTFTAMITALWNGVESGELLTRTWYSIKVLLIGYATGITAAALLTAAAIVSRIGNDFLETMTAMLNPLPAIALLPLALLWFGLGNGSLVFVLVHSVLWPVALNTHSGFMAVSNTLRMVGRNAGLKGLRYVITILIPAAFGSILTGLKIGWAFSWRTLIAAELVFGVSSGSGGLGWFIYMNKNNLETANVFAGLFMVVLIGLFVESAIFRTLELATVRKWGMHS